MHHQQQQQMQQQSVMAGGGGYYPNNLTTDHIQQYLDENKSLILKIVDNQNSGKLSECAENQARLQRNLMYLAAIADSQPQPTMHSQYAQSGLMHSGAHYLQAQQAQQMTPQSLMAARSSMLYSQQQYSTLQQQQALQSHLSMSSGGTSGGLHGLQNEANSSGSTGHLAGSGGFPDLRRMTSGSGASKQDVESSGCDGGDTLYLKSGDDNN